MIRRLLIARRVRRALRPPFFEDFIAVADRKSSAFAVYLQARRATGPDAEWRRAKARSEHLWLTRLSKSPSD